jgi:hypothetical protein
MPNLESISVIHVDVDPKALMVAGRDEIRGKLATLPAPVELRDSGHGFHTVIRLREPAMAGTAALERISEMRSAMTAVLAGDRACDHHVCLLRRPGTSNRKHGEPKLCRILRPAAPISLEEAGNLIEALGVSPWFGRGTADPRVNRHRIKRQPGEYDPVADLQAMEFEGGDHAIHPTQLRATKGLMFDNVPLIETGRIVLRATRDAARGLGWDWYREQMKISGMSYTAVDRWPQLHPMLPDVMYSQWKALHAQTGRIPRLIKADATTGGWTVMVDPAEELVPPEMAVLEGWLRRATVGGLPASALKLANLVFLDPTLRAEGYVRLSAVPGMPQRSLERARGTMIARRFLKRIPGGGERAACFVLGASANSGGE